MAWAQPKEEVRAVWLTTNWALDWPKTTGETNQKAELDAIYDNLIANNFNTVHFQIRSRGDLLYPSTIEPWAYCIGGSDPGWDPTAYAIQQAHARGLEIHAWFVTFRAYSSATAPSASNHVVNTHPEFVTPHEEGTATNQWIDPGVPAARDYVVSIVDEIVTNYPTFDGIHFDYCRYPEADFDDDTTFATYGVGETDKAQWRRDNINTFMASVYNLVQAKSPNMKVGSAPIGIYKSITNAVGWEAYHVLGQDARQWMISGNHDYVCPQIYWDLGSNPKFQVLANDWVNNVGGRHVYTGINAASLGVSKKGKYPEEHVLAQRSTKLKAYSATEILNQIDAARTEGALGQSYYRYATIGNNVQTITDQMKASRYAYPANIPAMLWKDAIAPNAPSGLAAADNGTSYDLSWTAPTAATDGDGAIYYNVYAFDNASIDLSDITKVVAFRVNGTSVNLNGALPTDKYFVVTAYDKGYNESAPSNIVSPSVGSVVLLNAPATATVQAANTILSWFAFSDATSYNVAVAENATFGKYTYEQAEISGTQVHMVGLKANTKYFWKVKASNTTEWSAVRNFTTALAGSESILDDFSRCALVCYRTSSSANR